MDCLRVAAFLALVAMATALSTGLNRQLQKKIISLHNKYRQEVNGANMNRLQWSSSLATAAAQWVSHCQWKHEPGQKTGENLAMVKGAGTSAASLVDSGLKMWIKEKPHYHYGGDVMTAGHYTQIIWASTTHVGCAVKKCPNNVMMMSCKYSPPGNFRGQTPYIKGHVCSKCPAGKHCHKHLCV